MIQRDQPTIFGTAVRTGVSSRSDGNMKRGIEDDEAVEERKRAFLAQIGITTHNVTTQLLTYDGVSDFARYATATTHGPTRMVADAIATQDREIALFLPLADCTGAVLYDPVQHVLMVSHLGRHSTEQLGAMSSVRYLQQQFGSRPRDILVWLSPSPNKDDYPLWKFDNRSFSDVLSDQLRRAGITTSHIEVSTADTIRGDDYFSHSEYVKGNVSFDGRHAVVAMLGPAPLVQ